MTSVESKRPTPGSVPSRRVLIASVATVAIGRVMVGG